MTEKKSFTRGDLIRHKNLIRLLREFAVEHHQTTEISRRGVLKDFSAFTGMDYNFCSQLKQRKRAVTEDTAAKLEIAFKKPPGWMSSDHGQLTEHALVLAARFQRLPPDFQQKIEEDLGIYELASSAKKASPATK